ncbi:tetratricopeptide repeat protein [bacterium]|nr:tetratricopeptide repeat protein [bacterium]
MTRPPGPAAGPTAIFRQVIEALNRGAPEAAMVGVQHLLATAPRDPAVQQLAAQVQFARGGLAQAEAHVRASLDLRPDHPPTLILAGRIARAAGNLPLARSRLDRAAALAPDLPDPAFEAAAVRLAAGEAEADLPVADLARRFPRHAPGWIDLGRAFEARGLAQAALAAYRRAEPILPSAALFSAMAGLLLQTGQPALAEAALDAALRLDPRFVPAWFKLGLVRQDRRDLAGAAEAYRQALSLRPDTAEVETNLGIVLQEAGDLAEAKRAYGRAILLRGESFGPIAQALTMAPTGELWLDLGALRAHLCELGRLPR